MSLNENNSRKQKIILIMKEKKILKKDPTTSTNLQKKLPKLSKMNQYVDLD